MKFKTTLLACSMLTFASCSTFAAADFDLGVQEFRAGRYSAAWGNFYGAANAGDPDAARLALHMLAYGPLLYGTHWDASTEQVQSWVQVSRDPRARPVPAYKPPAYAQEFPQ